MKILLMEDEPLLRKNIERFFRLKGHRVDGFENGEEVLEKARPEEYDCLVLDVNTPEVDGFELLGYLRERRVEVPALFISALTDVEKVLQGFRLGAGDYLKKPFELAELEIRLLRLTGGGEERLELGEGYLFDFARQQLFRDGTPSKLSLTQRKVLYLLLKNRNLLVTFEMLTDYVWEEKEVAHNTILSTMRDLKKRLPEKLVRNVKGEGYTVEL